MSREINKRVDFIYIAQLLKRFLLPFKGYMITWISITSAVSFTIIFREYLLKQTINTLANHDNTCFYWLGLLCMNFIIVEVMYRVYDKMSIIQRPLLKKYIINDLMQQLLNYSYSFYQRMTSAQLSLCISNICEGVEDLAVILFDDFLQCFLTIIFSTVIVWLSFNLTFALLFFAWGALWVVCAWYLGNSMFLKTRLFSDKQIFLSRNIADLLNEIFIVYSFNNQKHEINNIDQWTEDMSEAERNLRHMQYNIWLAQGIVCVIMSMLLLLYCIYLFNKNQATIGDFILVFGTISTIYGKIWDLSKNIREFIEIAGKVSQSMRMITCHITPNQDVLTGDKLIVSKGEIIFDHIVFRYGQGTQTREIFKGNDYIKINGGELISIVGSSGSGKSTLMNLLLRIFEINAGNIFIDGQNLRDVNLASLRQNIAIIPQDAGLFLNRTIAENIAYGVYNEINEHNIKDIMIAARQAQAHDFIVMLAKGYHTSLFAMGQNLSVGQKQRIAIARGFLRKASIFIFDEATSALDNNTQSNIHEDLFALTKNKTTIMIDHRLHTTQYADKILVFNNGNLVQSGKHSELAGKEGCYKELWDNR